MNINAINNASLNFGAKVKLSQQNKKAFYNMNLEEKLYEIDPNSKTSIISRVEEFAERHGFKEVRIALRSPENKVKINEHGDLLTVSCGPKPTTIRFDNETSSKELSGTLLGNIQENYNIIHPKKF